MVATSAFARTVSEGDPAPMSDAELAATLQNAMGVFAGCASGLPARHLARRRPEGLGQVHIHNHVTEPPVFSGAASIRMARECYRIFTPGERQLSLW